jgi:hypothetical protein
VSGQVWLLWQHYFQNTQGLVSVVGSHDRERADKALEELMRMLAEDKLQDAILLVFANTQVLPDAMNTAENTSWGCTLYATGTGTFRSPVPPVGMGSMKDWIGCPVSSRTRASAPPHFLLSALCFLLLCKCVTLWS